jgi:VWFA-related protein
MAKFIKKTACLSILLMFMVSFAESQSPERKKDPEVTIRLDTDLVVFDAQILNKNTGRALGVLKREEVEVYEDGVKQEIVHFSQDKLPLSVVLLLDVSFSVRPGLKKIEEKALLALERLKVEDEVALMVFPGIASNLVQDFTKDRYLVANKIRTIGKYKGEGSPIEEAIYQAARHINNSSTPGNRKVILVVSDDEATPPNEITEKDVTNELLESGSVVCGLILGPFIPASIKYLPNGWLTYKIVHKRDKQALKIKESVRPHANETGGIVIAAQKSDVGIRLIEMIEALRARYTIGYTPSNTQMDSKFRNIKLNVLPEVERREGGVTIFAKQGYYARKRERNAK